MKVCRKLFEKVEKVATQKLHYGHVIEDTRIFYIDTEVKPEKDITPIPDSITAFLPFAKTTISLSLPGGALQLSIEAPLLERKGKFVLGFDIDVGCFIGEGLIDLQEKDLEFTGLLLYKPATGLLTDILKEKKSTPFLQNIKDLAKIVLKHIYELNTTDRFIVEVTNRKNKKKGSKYSMPEYILLKPGEIRKKLGLSEHQGGTKRVHERRAHLRKYPDDKIRFPKAHGKLVRIPAVWIGQSEGISGNKHYKVILS